MNKFEEIVKILVAGGYFRARINGLSPFDKVWIVIILILLYSFFFSLPIGDWWYGVVHHRQ